MSMFVELSPTYVRVQVYTHIYIYIPLWKEIVLQIVVLVLYLLTVFEKMIRNKLDIFHTTRRYT